MSAIRCWFRQLLSSRTSDFEVNHYTAADKRFGIPNKVDSRIINVEYTA